MPDHANHKKSQPPETGLAVRRVPNELLRQPGPAHPLAEVMPEDGTMPTAPMTKPSTGAGAQHTHQHVHLHVEAPRQPVYWSYRRTTIYYGSRGLPNSSPTALPAAESAIAGAMVRCVQLILWVGGGALAVYFVGKYMKWW